MSEQKLYIAIVTCKECGEEIAKSKPATEEQMRAAEQSAPFHAFCETKKHNSESDINFNYEFTWEEQKAA